MILTSPKIISPIASNVRKLCNLCNQNIFSGGRHSLLSWIDALGTPRIIENQKMCMITNTNATQLQNRVYTSIL